MRRSGIPEARIRLADAVYAARVSAARVRRHTRATWAGMVEPGRYRLAELRAALMHKGALGGSAAVAVRRRRRAAVLALALAGVGILTVLAATLGPSDSADRAGLGEPPQSGGAQAPATADERPDGRSSADRAARRRGPKTGRPPGAARVDNAPAQPGRNRRRGRRRGGAGGESDQNSATAPQQVAERTPTRRRSSSQTIKPVAQRQPSGIRTPTPPEPSPVLQPQPAPEPAEQTDRPPESQAPDDDEDQGPKGGKGPDGGKGPKGSRTG